MNEWSDLGYQEQDILCRAALNAGFKVRENHFNAPLYRNLERKGFLREYSRGKVVTTYILTDQGAAMLAAMPDALERDWWPLAQDIAEIKKRLSQRNPT